MKLSPLALLLGALLIPVSNAQTDKVDEADRVFLHKATQANLAEIEAGKLAQAKSTRGDVKQFGQKMENEHGKTLAELKALAAKNNVTVPDKPDPAHQALAKQLSVAEGKEFDRIYIGNAGVADHKAAKELFEKGSKSKDKDIQALAKKTLPHIEEHLAMAKRMAETL